MTAAWNRITATGSGHLAWRVSIDGWPADLVTHRDMVFPIKAYARGVFSASNYYQATSASVLQGGTSMSGAVLFRYNAAPGANAVLIEQLAATGGWFVYTNAAGQVAASIRNSGGTLQVAEIGGLVAGVVYCVAWSWDGTNHRVALVGDDGSSATTNETPSFTYNQPGALPAAMGAFNGGGNPATNVAILGALWADTTSKSEAELTAICEACLQAGQVVEYTGATNMWRAPDLGTDLLGSVDFTEQGSVPRVAVSINATDGRERAHGLSSDGFTFGQKVDLVTAKAEGSSFRVRFSNPKKGAELFGRRPSKVTYLTSNETSTATTIRCDGAQSFPTSGTAYVDTEAFAYTATATNGFLGCTRGKFLSFKQYHYTTDGERLRYPEITDHPVVLEGRRVRFYAYAPGDDKRGDGTLVWVGVASTDANFNGIAWSFQVDSLFSLLDQEIGTDLADPVPIRGIYYPESAPLIVELREFSGATATGDPTRAWFALAGFWENQDSFLDDVNTAIAARISAAGFTTSDIFAVRDRDSWGIAFTTDAVTPLMIDVVCWSAVDMIKAEIGTFSLPGPRFLSTPDFDVQPVVTTSKAYLYRQQLDGGGTVPRTTFGAYDGTATQAASLSPSEHYVAGGTSGAWTGAYPPYTIFVGGGAGVTANTTSIRIEWSAPDGVEGAYDGDLDVLIDSIDATNRSFTTFRPRWGTPDAPRRFAASLGAVATVRMSRDYGSGNLAEFINTLLSQTAQWANTGAVPMLYPAAYSHSGGSGVGDFVVSSGSSGEIPAAAVTEFQRNRFYSIFDEVTLRDLVEQECRLLGVYPVIESGQYITFKRIRLPSPGEVATKTITSEDILSDDQIVSWERAPLGLFNTVRIRTGYDSKEDDHKGDTFVIRDVAAYGQSPNSRMLEIAPLSQEGSLPVRYEDALAVGRRVVGVFGGPYVYVTLELSLRFFGVDPGDVVSVTWSKLPNDDGTLGVTGKLGIVTSTEWKPMEGRGLVTIMLTDQRVGGYCPASIILVVTNGTDGTTGPFTVSVSADYFPSGSAGDYFQAGDKIRIYQVNSTTTSNNVTGTIDSVASNSITFTADSAWTRGSNTWAIGYQVSTSITADNQKVFAFIASGTDGLVDFSGDTDNPPSTFAP